MYWYATWVSIPYRYSSNSQEYIEMCKKAEVSIPYRYSSNLWESHKTETTNVVFQFLIGTLQTEMELLKRLRKLQFQFLIGTLQTRMRGIPSYGGTGGFNSL